MITGKHEHQLAALACEEDPDLQPGAKFENGPAQFTDAKAGMGMGAAQGLRQTRDGGVDFGYLRAGVIFSGSDDRRAG
jgi:hypothetical protein